MKWVYLELGTGVAVVIAGIYFIVGSLITGDMFVFRAAVGTVLGLLLILRSLTEWRAIQNG